MSTQAKPGRRMSGIQVMKPMAGLTLVRFTIKQDGAEERYSAFHCDDRATVEVGTSDDADRQYRVTCAAGKPTACGCKGHGRWGTVCKHMAAVSKLAELGHLTIA